MGEKHQAGQRAGTARRGRGRPGGSSGCKWEEQHVKVLSTLLLRFKRRCGRLPSPSDHTFWQLCCDCLHARFTPSQLLYKMHYLKRRFVRHASGHVNAITLSEREVFRIWTQIMQQQVPPKPSSRAPLSSSVPGRGTQVHGQQAPHKTAAASARGKHAKKGGPFNGKGKFNGLAEPDFKPSEEGSPYMAKSTRNEQEEPENSTCSEGIKLPTMSSEHEEHETFTRHDGEGAQDSSGVRSAEGAYLMSVLQHTTVADLAASTRLLAEILHSRNPRQ